MRRGSRWIDCRQAAPARASLAGASELHQVTIVRLINGNGIRWPTFVTGILYMIVQDKDELALPSSPLALALVKKS